MNSEKPDDGQTGPIGPAGNWASTFVDYLALKLRLFVIESTEATGHCLRPFVLLGDNARSDGRQCPHPWSIHSIPGNTSLTSGLGLERSNLCHHTHSTGSFDVFAGPKGLRKPMFRTSMKELEKDKEWLSQSKTKLS
jgi:hypothetical protein